MRTPMAIMASNGAVEAPLDCSAVSFRSVVLDERRSVAEERMLVLVEVAWA